MRKLMLTDLAAESDDDNDGRWRETATRISHNSLSTRNRGQYPVHILFLHPQPTPWDGHCLFFVDEERRRRGVPNSLGCLSQNQNLKQSDHEIVPGLTQILKIVKNDPSSPGDKLCWQVQPVKEVPVVPRTIDGKSAINAADSSRDIGYSVEGVTRRRCPTLTHWQRNVLENDKDQQVCKASDFFLRKQTSGSGPIFNPMYHATPTYSKARWLRLRMTDELECSRKGINKNYQERKLSQSWTVRFRHWSPNG